MARRGRGEARTRGESAGTLAPVAGHPVDEETLRLACRMTRELKQSNVTPRLYVVHVIEVTRALPLSAPVHQQVEQGEQILDNAERIAGEYGLEIQTEMVQARDTGPAIVGEADDWHADMVGMGLPPTRRFG